MKYRSACFLVVTDREDLDGQIYRNFLHTGTVTQAEVAEPKDSEEMRKFLGQNKRLVFTLIQKFRWDKGKDYPELSPRSDIIVIDCCSIREAVDHVQGLPADGAGGAQDGDPLRTAAMLLFHSR